MIERFLWLYGLLVCMAVCLSFAGGALTALTVRDMRRCGRLTPEHLIRFFCAGSTFALALLIVII